MNWMNENFHKGFSLLWLSYTFIFMKYKGETELKVCCLILSPSDLRDRERAELSWLTYFSDGAKQSSTAREKTGLLALLRQDLILQDGRGQARPSSPALEDEILLLIPASNWQRDFSSVLTPINRVEPPVSTRRLGNISIASEKKWRRIDWVSLCISYSVWALVFLSDMFEV